MERDASPIMNVFVAAYCLARYHAIQTRDSASFDAPAIFTAFENSRLPNEPRFTRTQDKSRTCFADRTDNRRVRPNYSNELIHSAHYFSRAPLKRSILSLIFRHTKISCVLIDHRFVRRSKNSARIGNP